MEAIGKEIFVYLILSFAIQQLAYVIDSNSFLVESMQLRRKACPHIRHIRLSFCINYTALCKIYSLIISKWRTRAV
jgi:hypothetical protein